VKEIAEETVHAWPARLALGARAGCRHRADPGHDPSRARGGERRRARVELTEDDLARIDEAAPSGVAAGERYDEAGMAAVHN